MNAATDPMIGRMIDQRYRVRSRIARGGMATVYLATDVRLERRVAIKIMHGHLADDVAFRNRFIQEARSAARLSHPSVVGVYDQGAEDDAAYIVMEYIPGITLRDLLQEHTALTSEQALDILRAVLGGLASAHRAGIVHRDLKPENVLLADDGRIKLGDFGLARAASANTATGAALLGTIAYLSPELVTRGVADTRSDIYAVGIMLYEMLTGEQPYKGDQPMQIAYQHANDTVPAPGLANPSVPRELDELVLWATARNPDDRPRDAKTMLDALAGVEGRIADPNSRTAVIRPLNTTSVLPRDDASGRNTTSARPPTPGRNDGSGRNDGPDRNGGPDRGDSDDTTVLGDRRSGVHPQPSGGRGAFSGSQAVGGGGAVAPGADRHGQRPTGPNGRRHSGQALSPAAERLADKSGRRRKRGWIALAIIVVLVLVAGGVAWYLGPGPGGNVRIPAVTGKSVSEARQLLEARGLHTDRATSSRHDADIDEGEVSATRPSATATVRKGTSVRLVVSSGPRLISLPAIVGQPLSTVTAALDDDFSLEKPSYRFDPDAAKDTVLAVEGVNEDGSGLDLTTVQTYPERQPIRLTVSLGAVPDVVGKTAADATTTLQGVGLTVSDQQTGKYSDDVPTGQVIATTIQDDPVVEGSQVVLTVSKGPAPISLPDVTGKTISQAASTLEALGLKVSYPDCTNILCSFYDWKSSLPVSGMDPGANATVHKGDTVTLSYKQ
ncbi:protein kinase domain-containing protein [Curtobacterium sp. Leaf261]|uniref:protein kinase domain-containing protein n=1 Tax=Curtobacterium sp. Leaf261 TaxID=1736311 RepID=UPI001F2EEF7D|nr:protein kinase [Curtobacterium sp. Leaf261]